MMKRCGNCCAFEVKNADDATLAQISQDESQCRPVDSLDPRFGMQKVGCHGGHVMGACRKWQERAERGMPFQADMPGVPPVITPRVDSGFSCSLWEGGGPVIRGQPPACGPKGSSNLDVGMTEAGKQAIAYGVTGLLVMGSIATALYIAVKKDRSEGDIEA